MAISALAERRDGIAFSEALLRESLDLGGKIDQRLGWSAVAGPIAEAFPFTALRIVLKQDHDFSGVRKARQRHEKARPEFFGRAGPAAEFSDFGESRFERSA